jgi:thiopurine S-methyltransferase
VRAFFDEHGAKPIVSQRGPFTVYEHGAIAILAGDLFDASPEIVGPLDALYDRAAMVALPKEVRPRYAAHLRKLLPKGAPGIVLTFEYDQARIDGPPFSVPEAELRALYAEAGEDVAISFLDEGPGDVPRFRDAGVPATERCFVVQF